MRSVRPAMLVSPDRTLLDRQPGESDPRYTFVSYTRREHEVKLLKPLVDEFLKALSTYTWRQFGIWYDGVDIDRSEPNEVNLRQAIIEGMNKCDFTTEFISPTYIQ